MARDDNDREPGPGTEGRDEGVGPRERRAPGGVGFWVLMAFVVVSVGLNAFEGDLLSVVAFALLGFFFVAQSARLSERSTAWRRACNSCVAVLGLLALLMLLRAFGIL